MKHILSKIQEYNKIIIIVHIRPDGDCFGSGFGLKHLIEANFKNKEVHVLGEPLPDFDYMGHPSNLSDEEFKGALVISVDTGSRSRVHDQRYETGEYLIRIDHHVHIDPFGDYEWVDTNSPATSYMITKLAMEENLVVTPKAAECLFTGIVTDTGRFRYRGVTSFIYEAAAFLTKHDIDQQFIYDRIYKKSYETLEFEGQLNTHLHRSPNGVLYATIPRDVIEASGLADTDVADFVSKLADIDGFPVWVLFYQVESGRIRARIRSAGVPINKVAEEFNGGGHVVAAGAVVDSFEEAKVLVNKLDEAIQNYSE